ncbi:MAG: DNA mismatch repair protein MutL [Firmicutes bacterium ADurb.Bin456]|nr:MAG: DNA mismatch repair protein MutL [Firmicutes bacterium ADurb.Bin456]
MDILPNIIILDPLTANQIAAGEVVEKPFSVVKELVENSIDAQAKRIVINLEGGGLAAISVSDDGYGMNREDLLLAFKRHATSKITCALDLCRVATLGFRGEALPSIASVSRVIVTTRTRNALKGSKAIVEEGKIDDVRPVGCPEGSTILVKDLFYNTPARRKAMKSPSVEGSFCGELVSRLALARPDLSFELKIQGKRVFYAPGSGYLLDSVTAVYGAQLAKQMLPVNFAENGLILTGLTGKPSLSRSTRGHITVIINGRYVRCPVITTAVEEAYHSLLPKGRRPVAVLALRVEPEFLDVNIHPAKLEVRLLEEEKIACFVTRVLRETLRVKEIIPGAKATRLALDSGKQHENQVELALPPQQYTGDPPPLREVVFRDKDKTEYETSSPGLSIEVAHMGETGSLPAEGRAWVEGESTGTRNTGKELPVLKALAYLHPVYILAGGKEGLYIVDQHAAHERILYEGYLARKEQKESQCLLLPVMLELDYRDAAVLANHVVWFNDAGFIIEHFGDYSFMLRGVPAHFPAGEEKNIFIDLLDYFREKGQGLDRAEFHHQLSAAMACRGAVKGGERLSLAAMDALLESLAQTSNPFTCPHGRPTIIHMSHREMEKRFKR